MILAAEYTNGSKTLPAKLDIVEIVGGERVNRRTPFSVSGKREAREIAKALGATPWNF
jgi:hypothetical protein